MGAVDVKQTHDHELTLEWESSASNDMIADSTLALITGIDKSPASVKCPLWFSSICCTSFLMLREISDDTATFSLTCSPTR